VLKRYYDTTASPQVYLLGGRCWAKENERMGSWWTHVIKDWSILSSAYAENRQR